MGRPIPTEKPLLTPSEVSDTFIAQTDMPDMEVSNSKRKVVKKKVVKKRKSKNIEQPLDIVAKSEPTVIIQKIETVFEADNTEKNKEDIVPIEEVKEELLKSEVVDVVVEKPNEELEIVKQEMKITVTEPNVEITKNFMEEVLPADPQNEIVVAN